jgi:hypothetical protein
LESKPKFGKWVFSSDGSPVPLITDPGGKTCTDGGRCGEVRALSDRSRRLGYTRTSSRSSCVVNDACMIVILYTTMKHSHGDYAWRATHVARFRSSHTLCTGSGQSAMGRQKLSPQGQRLRTIILTVPIMAATSGLQPSIASREMPLTL